MHLVDRRESPTANASGSRAWHSFLGAALLVACGACSVPPDCVSYQPVSVAAMRSGFWSGCFELSNVVVIARTPSTSGPRVYVQDPKGGDLSAIMAKCSSTSLHACPAATGAQVLQLLDGAAVTLQGSYHRDMQTGFEELYLDHVVDHGSLLEIPAPAVLTVAQITRAARTRNKWFQVAKVNVPDGDPLVMFDLSPAELRLSGAACPYWSGFAMIPLSAGYAPPMDCDTSTTPPTNPPTRDGHAPDAVLIGRRFFDGFSYSADCACAAEPKQHSLASGSFVEGKMMGVLGLELGSGSGDAHQVFQPLSKDLFPVAGF